MGGGEKGRKGIRIEREEGKGERSRRERWMARKESVRKVRTRGRTGERIQRDEGERREVEGREREKYELAIWDVCRPSGKYGDKKGSFIPRGGANELRRLYTTLIKIKQNFPHI